MSMRKLFPKAAGSDWSICLSTEKFAECSQLSIWWQTMAIVIDDPRHGLQLIFARRGDKKCTSQVKNAPFTNVDAC